MNKSLGSKLQNWYLENKRDLPWRQNQDPYGVWLSEIMLQQTTVKTVIPYYEKFLELFPTVEDLARAKEEQVLSLWSGLGYYLVEVLSNCSSNPSHSILFTYIHPSIFMLALSRCSVF